MQHTAYKAGPCDFTYKKTSKICKKLGLSEGSGFRCKKHKIGIVKNWNRLRKKRKHESNLSKLYKSLKEEIPNENLASALLIIANKLSKY